MGNETSKEQQASPGEAINYTEKDAQQPPTKAHQEQEDDDVHDHDFEIVNHQDSKDNTTPNPKHQPQEQNGLWIGIDLGTSNCASAIWDSTRGRPKWMRLKDLAIPSQSGNKAGRVVPSAVQLRLSSSSSAADHDDAANKTTISPDLWKDILKWNPDWTPPFATDGAVLMATVGYTALSQLQQDNATPSTTTTTQDSARIITSVKRVLGVCDTTNLNDLDPEFRDSLPFIIEENSQGQWIIPCEVDIDIDTTTTTTTTIYVRPVHIAAMILQAIRQAAQTYLSKAVRKKKMQLPGMKQQDLDNKSSLPPIRNVVVGVPAYFGQTQRHAVEQAARLAGFEGHVSTLTESTAAAMAYGLFVGSGQPSSNTKAILVLDMGGGTTDITIAQMSNSSTEQQQEDSEGPDQKFRVILTDGDSRLGGEDMDQALFDLVLDKAKATAEKVQLTPQQKQILLRSCQQAKETLCGDVDHGDPPAESAIVHLPESFPVQRLELTTKDLETAIQPLLERTAKLVERSLQRYADKLPGKGTKEKEKLVREVILIGGATRVPALRTLLKERFFSTLELCTSVNAMGAVAQGTAIQAAIVSKCVPLHALRSAMMLDTVPHTIGVLLPSSGNDGGDEDEAERRFVDILSRDSPLPANGYTTFFVADLDQKGVTVSAVELIEDAVKGKRRQYQPLGDFTFLLHRLSESQREAILQDDDHPGLRPVDIGMTLGADGAFQVSIFDPHDPDHRRKREFHEKAKHQGYPEAGILDYVQAAADLKSEGITAEETKLLVFCSFLFVFYVVVKVLLPSDDIMAASHEL